MPQNNDDSAFISQSTQIWGNVEFQEGSSAWFGTLIRSVQGQIQIGKNTHINDQSRIANNNNATMHIGDNVYIGSRCNLSDCEIANHCYIGDGSTIYSGSIIPENSFIAPNSLVTSQTIFPPGSFIQGAPASTTGYVGEQMRDEYYQSLSKMQKNIGYFRKLLPNAEQNYYLIQFGANQKLLEQLFAAGAGTLDNIEEYTQSSTRKIRYKSATEQSKKEKTQQEIVYAISCSSDKLYKIIQILNQHFKNTESPMPGYQIQPIHTSQRAPKTQKHQERQRQAKPQSTAQQENTSTSNSGWQDSQEAFERDELASAFPAETAPIDWANAEASAETIPEGMEEAIAESSSQATQAETRSDASEAHEARTHENQATHNQAAQQPSESPLEPVSFWWQHESQQAQKADHFVNLSEGRIDREKIKKKLNQEVLKKEFLNAQARNATYIDSKRLQETKMQEIQAEQASEAEQASPDLSAPTSQKQRNHAEQMVTDLYPEFYNAESELKSEEELPNEHLYAIMLRSELHKA